MIFVDSNVPMYLVGRPHPNRERVEQFIRRAPERTYVTSVEVYQEIIHRYVAIDRREAIDDAFDFLDVLAETIYPVRDRDVRRAHEIVCSHTALSGRDCLHIAVMELRDIDSILTCDRGFDAWPQINRLPGD